MPVNFCRPNYSSTIVASLKYTDKQRTRTDTPANYLRAQINLYSNLRFNVPVRAQFLDQLRVARIPYTYEAA